MRFINSILFAASALASFAAAQSTVIQFTKVPTSVVAGTPVTLEWKTTDSTTPVTIKLRVGPSNDLSDVQILTSDGTDGTFTWTPSKGLGDATNYALEIDQGKEVNYSGPIALSGGSASSLPATASASASASASFASSASSASSASASSASVSASSASVSAASASGTTLSTATITGASSSHSASSASKTGSASSGSITAATTKTTGSASTTTGSAMGAPTSKGAAATMGSSPVALIFGAVAAMAYLN